MPKQKIRKKTKLNCHYNEFAGVIQGDFRRKMTRPFGLKPIRVKNRKDIALRKKRRLGRKMPSYMGSVITPENRWKFMVAQGEMFKQKHIAKVIADREAIENQEDKTPDEIDAEVREFNAEQVNEEQLHEMSLRFGRFQANKEKKHESAFLKGNKRFRFGKHLLPVMTDEFINQTRSFKQILNIDPEAQINVNAEKEEE